MRHRILIPPVAKSPSSPSPLTTSLSVSEAPFSALRILSQKACVGEESKLYTSQSVSPRRLFNESTQLQDRQPHVPTWSFYSLHTYPVRTYYEIVQQYFHYSNASYSKLREQYL